MEEVNEVFDRTVSGPELKNSAVTLKVVDRLLGLQNSVESAEENRL